MSDEKWLLCLDPESSNFYTLNLKTNQLHIEFDVPENMRARSLKTLKEIRTLLNLESNFWLMHSKEAWLYRRRKLPTYLIQKVSCDYPVYLSQSSLSLAFAEVSTIKLEVNLSEYRENMATEAEERGIVFSQIKNTVMIDAGLVTGSEEVIKNILRTVHRESGIKLRTKNQGNKFILKFSGFREYMTGNQPLLSYDRIRINLRGLKTLTVILMEADKDFGKKTNFPPLVSRDPNKVKDLIFEPINWNEFKDSPFFLWYSPKKLPSYLDEGAKILTMKLMDKDMLCRPRVINKGFFSDFLNIRRQQRENNILNIDQNLLYSGECDNVFKIRIIGLENVQLIFELAEEKQDDLEPNKNATYNGLEPPTYITKSNGSKEPEAKAKKKRSASALPKSKRHTTPKFVKDRESQGMKNYNPNDVFLNSHLNHGFSGTQRLHSIQKRFGLNFPPYLLSIQCSLYFGSYLFTTESFTRSKQVPFTLSPKWYEWLEFNSLKISQLQQEVRLTFEVHAHTANGDSQIIASTVLQIFDGYGRYQQGLHKLNLWPFYRIDPRLSSMTQFYGMRDAFPLHGEDLDIFNDLNFPQLYVQLDSFVKPMVWTMRDEKYFASLGFANLDLGKKFYDEYITELSNPSSIIKTLSDLVDRTKSSLKRGSKLGTLQTNDRDWKATPRINDLAKLQTLLNIDPLKRNSLTPDEKFILLLCRHHYKSLPQALQIFLKAINWADPEQVSEAHRMIKQWAPLTPEDALCLLDADFADEVVRLYAVERISGLSDDELALYLIELIQALMFEPQHYSALGEFLIERSLANPYVVGHEFFWLLRSQLHVKPSYERYSLLLEQLLMLCGPFKDELFRQVYLNDKIMLIAEEIKKVDDKSRLKELKLNLSKFQEEFKSPLTFALDPRLEGSEFLLEKVKVMDSKKLPVWLTIKNSQPECPNIAIIFKTGDDLRQDILTIQLIKIMDKIWLDNGYDFRMKPYKVIATLDQVGMIEVVLNSDTTSNIHSDMGGAFGALSKNTILQFLKVHNPEESAFSQAKDNFLKSCAGYCVATYVLGVGDRHSGNIMLTKTGHLFHIDFGHFLGNFKKKFGFKRERSAFVFTEEMAFVMGGREGELFKDFERYCTDAFNLVRKHGNFLISIFMLMTSAGMPELQDESDIEFLKNQLALHLSEQEATNIFKKEIRDSLNSQWRRIDNFIHNIKRKG